MPRMKAGKTSLDPRAQDFLSSHPATPERVQNAQASARQYTSPEGGERDRETYLAAIDNIVYGEDPSEGFVRGRRFLHPKLGFTFQAPDTFTLDNTAQAVIGVREGGTQAMRFDVVRVPAEQSLGDYLNSGWMEGVEKSSTEDITINGFPAAAATAHGDSWQFKVYALRFGSDVYRFIFAAKQKTTESERNARETVNSFRRLTLEEIQAARPLRIKVITVQPGDTVESLAHRMAGVDRPAERFRDSQRARRRTPRSRRAIASRSWWIEARSSSPSLRAKRNNPQDIKASVRRCAPRNDGQKGRSLIPSLSMLRLVEHDDHTGHFGFMRLQAGESRIAPIGKADYFAGSRCHFRHSDRLQHLETAAVEKKRVLAEQIVQLGDRRMIVGKNLSLELAQRLFHLCRIQLHDLLHLLFGFSRSGCARRPGATRGSALPPPRRCHRRRQRPQARGCRQGACGDRRPAGAGPECLPY